MKSIWGLNLAAVTRTTVQIFHVILTKARNYDRQKTGPTSRLRGRPNSKQHSRVIVQQLPNIWPWAPDEARHTDWPAVAMWLWLWLKHADTLVAVALNKRQLHYTENCITPLYICYFLKNSAFWDVTPCGSCKNRRTLACVGC
jgi:hypothetical protein